MKDNNKLEENSQSQLDIKDAPKALGNAPLEILKEKFQEGRLYASLSVTTFTLYLAANGALLKFSLDAHPSTITPVVLAIIGAAASVLYLFVSSFKNRVRERLSRDVEHLNEILESPLVAEQFLVLKYISITTFYFSVFALVGWLVLALRFVKR